MERIMVKSCCAVGCTNQATKESGRSFYRFPTDSEWRRWIVAVRREKWTPSEHTWICSAHFVNGKSNDPASPDYVPSIFSHISSPLKKRQVAVDGYYRWERVRHVHTEASRKTDTVVSLEKPGTSEVVGELQPCRGKVQFQFQLIEEALYNPCIAINCVQDHQ